jgi:hypothetical protein
VISRSAPVAPAPFSGRVRVISCAWGTEHVSEFLEYCLPALLSPGNLPAICEVFDCEIVFLTEESRFDIIAAHPSWRNATRVCPARLIALDDLLIGPDSYGMTLTQALHRGFSDQGPAMTANWQIFFNSDFIVADGGLKRLAQEMLAGHRLILSPSYCVNAEAARPILDLARNPQTGAITISNRSMAEMILRHRHATVRGKTVNQALFSYLHNDQFYWLVDNYTLIGHQIPIAMIAMMPSVYLPEPTTYWDYGIVEDFLPNVTPLVLSDSDDFVMAELRAISTSGHNLRLGPRTIPEMAMSLHSFATRETVRMGAYQLLLHSRDFPAGLANAQVKLAELGREVIAQAGILPHHQQHFQWSHHLTRLHNSQNAYATAKTVSFPRVASLATTVSEVQRSPVSNDACAESRCAAIRNPTQEQPSQCPFRTIDEKAITQSIQHLLDPAIVSSSLTEAAAVELGNRFIHTVDLLLQKEVAAAQEAYRRAGRDVIETLIAKPPAEAEREESESLLASLRAKVGAVSRCQHLFDQPFSKQLGGPLDKWIQTVWFNAAALRDVSTSASEQAFTPLGPEALAVGSEISIRVKEILELFPLEQLREVYEPAIAGAIQEAVTSETVDMEALGWLFVRIVRLTYSRALLDQFSTMAMNESLEHAVLSGMSKTAHSFVGQFIQFIHTLHNFKSQLDDCWRERNSEFRDLVLEAANTLDFVEKLAAAGSAEGMLGIPLALMQNLGRHGSRRRFLERKVRWLHHLRVTEIDFAKFVSDRGRLTEKAVLHVDSGSSFTHSFTELARVRYWLPLSIARSPLACNIRQVRSSYFDLCIVDLDEADLASFAPIYKVIEPVICADAVVVLLARRMRGLELRGDDFAFITGMFPASGYARISYTGSATAQIAARIVESAKGICEGRNLPLSIGRVIELAAYLAAAPLAWGAAWIKHRRKGPATDRIPPNPISVALEVTIPRLDQQPAPSSRAIGATCPPNRLPYWPPPPVPVGDGHPVFGPPKVEF